MQFSKLVASIGLIVLGSFSINASAQTSVCTWGSTYGTSTSVTWLCRNSSNVTLATRTDTHNGTGQYWCGSVNVSSGYTNTGIVQGSNYPLKCNVTIVAANTPPVTPPVTPPTTDCHTGSSQIIQTSPSGYTPFNPSFCGPQPQCKFSVTPMSNNSYPPLKYTCL